jgi:asparagine synthase (glutamine-hydrolysing)
MCGIAGLIAFDGNDKLLDFVHNMTKVQRHRGPDDEGVCYFQQGKGKIWVHGGGDTPESAFGARMPYAPQGCYSGQKHEKAVVALGHRRLSILDLSIKGHQPMCTPDQRYWIVYNGEIYNYLELREELRESGLTFHSNSDTEVLLYAFARWGRGMLDRLVGMFAFAIYDREEKSFFLARDFFGIKPLYYSCLPGAFAFASEIKALLAVPSVSHDIHPERLHEYLCSGLTDYGGETMFEGVKQIPPGHYMCLNTMDPRGPRPVRYYDADIAKQKDISIGEAASRLRELFLESLRLHLRSDVAVGAALSGGIDSSAIVMGMRLLEGRKLDLRAFTYVAEDPALCEEHWADMVGNASAADIHKIRINGENIPSDLERLMFFQDEPFGSTSIYAQYKVMGLAKEKGIKVMLDGQGADELLAGYRSSCGAMLAALIRQCRVLKALSFCYSAVQHGHSQWPVLLMQGGRAFLPEALHPALKRLVGIDHVSPWLERKWFRERGVKARGYKGKGTPYLVREDLYRLLVQGELCSLLRYEDRNSMAYSIESRVPFLTPKLVSFLYSLPEDFLIDGTGMGKRVFRLAMRGIVPEGILNRRDKIGFTTPERKWLAGLRPWVEETLAGETAKSLKAIKLNDFLREWKNVFEGKTIFDWRLWRVINLIKWMEQKGAALV